MKIHNFFLHKLSFILGLFFLLIAAQPLFAAETIDEFNVDIIVNQNGIINVTEKILYNYSTAKSHGIIRYIPLTYNTDNDHSTIDIKIDSITDENRQSYFYTEHQDSYLYLKIGDPDKTITGAHWYYITYQVNSAIKGFADWDELYWNATGTTWDVSIKSAKVNITIPDGSSISNNQAVCYTGKYASMESQCTASVISPTKFFFASKKEFSAKQGFTIAASFSKNIVSLPASIQINIKPYTTAHLNNLEISGRLPHYIPYGEYILKIDKPKYLPINEAITLNPGEKKVLNYNLKKDPWILIIEVVGPIILCLMISLILWLIWWIKGRDLKGKGTIIPIYEAPQKLTPGEIGAIVDQRANLHDLTASIINFAILGYLKIKKENDNFQLIKLKEPNGLLNYEQLLWDKIFTDTKNCVKLSELTNKFYKYLPGLKKSLYKEVTNKGYFTAKPDKIRKIYFGLASLLTVLLGGGTYALIMLTESYWYFASALIIVIQGFIIASIMPKRTKQGTITLEEIQGFKMYLTHAERYRIEHLYSPKNYQETFEKYIPYAIVLKVENEWAQQFENLYLKPPTWYEGESYPHFTVRILIKSMNSFNATTAYAITSSPGTSYNRSSGTGRSSWSGGSGISRGSSGGGFGGGGGRSW